MKLRDRLNNWMKHAGCAVLLSVVVVTGINAQRVATLRATTTGKEQFSIPMQTELDAITILPDSNLQLVEIRNGKKINIPFQIGSSANGRDLYWQITPSVKTNHV